MIHTPVLTDAILDLFKPNDDSRLLDVTLGHGGHTKAFLAAAGPNATAVGLDADPAALEQAKKELAEFNERVTYINTNFANLKDSLVGGGILPGGNSTLTKQPSKPAQRGALPKPLAKGGSPQGEVGFSHILFDLGLGSHQLADANRGFSFQTGGPLSMAYGSLDYLPEANIDALNQLTEYLGHHPDASELIKHLAATDLADIIRIYGEERYANRIANRLHREKPTTAEGLAQLVSQAVPLNYEHGRIHPATRTFQALRLAVNRELEALQVALPQAVGLLADGGYLAVISFHSLEDRIVKSAMRAAKLNILTSTPTRAGPAEIAANPRSRAAKLRVGQK